jgi:hypothetical protein
MTGLKTLAVAAALVIGAASLASAQNGPPTGGNTPAAGGAGNSAGKNAMGSSGKIAAPAKTMKHKKKEM